MAIPPADRALPLRERKKRRTRRDLSEAALRLFLERGFAETTLDDVVEAAEVSKRTFFRNYASKEDVALAAETELWDAYVAALTGRPVHGHVLTALRDALTGTLTAMGDDWPRRFLATRGLIARTPVLRDRSDQLSLATRSRIAEALRDELALDDLRLHLLGELALAAWRTGARKWVGGPKKARLSGLAHDVRAAFDAVPGAAALTVP